MIPGQEREISNRENLSGLKLYEQDKDLYIKQRSAVIPPNRQRAKSAVPSRTSDGIEFRPVKKNFADQMFGGEGKVRKNPTFNSQVLPMNPSAQNLHSGIVDQHHDTAHKWEVDQKDIIFEKKSNDLKKKSEMYKMYMGLNDTPFQRYFKEHYGDKYQPPKTSNVKKQKDNLGQTVGFNQVLVKKDLYKNVDAEGRRAKELDSCLWAENNGQYKSFSNKDMAKKGKNDISASTNWKSKEAARVHDNNDKKIDAKKSTQDNLKSAVLPMDNYEAPTQVTQVEGSSHGIDPRRGNPGKGKNTRRQKVWVTNTRWNDTKAEGLSNLGGYDKKSTFMNLLNQSQSFRDPQSHYLTKSVDMGKTGQTFQNLGASNQLNQFAPNSNLNLSSLKRQENLASHFPLSNHYDKFITQKIDQSKNYASTGNLMATSQQFNHKQLKQKFLQGQEDRYLFNSEKKRQTESKTDVGVHTLELSNIPSHLNEADLKRVLGINHLVSLEVEADNLKNLSTGKGKISFRSNTENEKTKIQNHLKDMGIQSQDYKFKNKKKAPRVASSQIGIMDSRNEIDLAKGKRDMQFDSSHIRTQPKIKHQKKLTGKVGENLVLKPKDYLKSYKNESKTKRANFYESNADLFGNTNGSYAKTNTEKLKSDRKDVDKSLKDGQVQNKLINGKLLEQFNLIDWTKMQKRFDKYASNRALQPTITRYGRSFNF